MLHFDGASRTSLDNLCQRLSGMYRKVRPQVSTTYNS